jgi:signal peptidase I
MTARYQEVNLENFRSEEITEPISPGSQRPAWLTFLLETLQTLVLAVVLYFLIDSVIARVRVENISMEPTLQPGEFILVNKMAFKMGDIHRGDIIIFHYPQNIHEDYIKRVIGLGGDTVAVRNNKVYVNDQPLTEPYIAAAPAYTGTWVVPDGQLFVLGDNRNQSSDSHSWGFVPDDNIVGKALVVYWPLDQFKTLSQPLVVNAAH